MEARYLIGADGARSAIRKALDVGFDGMTIPGDLSLHVDAFPVS